jgi:N-acetylmuramoyl-L-alanine amidase
MTRSTDVSISVTARYLVANNNNANCFVSIHINSSTSNTAKGCTAIYPNNHDIPRSKLLAELVVDNVSRWTSLTKHRDAYIDIRDLGVLRFTSMPATISESGFMSNSSDLGYLITSSAKTKIGQQIGSATWYWLQFWG